MTNPKNLPAIFFIPHERAILLIFCHPTVVGGRRPFPPKMGDGSDPPAFENRPCRQISACNVSTVRASKKSSIMTNSKSPTRFPTSHQRRSWVVPNSSKWGVEIPNLPVFGIKVNFNWMKCAIKFLWEKTSSGKVVVHSFPYLTVHICWGGNTIPLTSDVAAKWRIPLTKCWNGDILACSSSAVTAS